MTYEMKQPGPPWLRSRVQSSPSRTPRTPAVALLPESQKTPMSHHARHCRRHGEEDALPAVLCGRKWVERAGLRGSSRRCRWRPAVACSRGRHWQAERYAYHLNAHSPEKFHLVCQCRGGVVTAVTVVDQSLIHSGLASPVAWPWPRRRRGCQPRLSKLASPSGGPRRL